MDNIEQLAYLVFFVVFVIVAIARKIAEQKEISNRQKDAQNRKPVDLPEATRRMLYGDDVPTARPRGFGGEDDEEGPVTVAPRREPQIPTAQPRQGQRRVAPPPLAPRQSTQRVETASPTRPVVPQRRADAPRLERPADTATAFRPVEEQRRVAPPMRQQAPPMRQQTPPMRQAPQASRRAAPPPVVRPQPTQRREAPPAQVQQLRRRVVPKPAAPQPKPALSKTRRAGERFFADRGDLRRAILLREILGPPKAFEGLD